MLLKVLQVSAGLLLVLGALRIMHLFRSRAMRNVATSFGFRYIGPPAPKWWNPPHDVKVGPPLPHWLASSYSFRQVWNVIEGQEGGKSIVIFDSIWGGRGGQPCTYIACSTEECAFASVSTRDHLVQSHGWSVVSGAWILWYSWFMSSKRIERYVNNMKGWYS